MRWIMFVDPKPIGRTRWRYEFYPDDALEVTPRLGSQKWDHHKERRRCAEEARRWCHAEFGKGLADHPVDWRWARDDPALRFMFRYEQDAFMFKIRWC